jgi:hypothetical protein
VGLKRAEDELKAMPEFLKVKRQVLAEKIAALKKELNV